MSPRYANVRALFARLTRFFRPEPRLDVPVNTLEFQRTCKELAFWSTSDAGLSGPIEGFDGSLLSRAADGMFTLRMTLTDGQQQRSPSDAATIVVRSLSGLRVLLLLEIDGRRFTYPPPNVNSGVRELCESFTNQTESAG